MAGIVADSQLATLLQPRIFPLMHWSGTLRFPVFLEDDIFFDFWPNTLPLEVIAKDLFSPGLKILNFHPTFVGSNCPTRVHYESVRSRVFGQAELDPEVIWSRRGTRDLLRELVGLILDSGKRFYPFEELVASIRTQQSSRFGAEVPDPIRRQSHLQSLSFLKKRSS